MLAYTAYKAIKDKKKKRDQKKGQQIRSQQQQQGNGDFGHISSQYYQTSASAHSPYSAEYPHSPNGGHSQYTTGEQQRMQQELSYAQHHEHTRHTQYNDRKLANAPADGQVQHYQHGGDPRYR